MNQLNHDYTLIESSLVNIRDTQIFLVKSVLTGEKFLGVSGDPEGFEGLKKEQDIYLAPLSPENAARLRALCPWLNPAAGGTLPSFGFGDRLGLATGGHLAASMGSGVFPVFAQQSVRENDRTGRTPQEVVDDVLWVLFENGWKDPWGADADHLKNTDSLPAFLQAGYSFFTIDPSDHVDNAAQTDGLDVLRQKISGLDWEALETTWEAWQTSYLKAPINLADLTLVFTEEILLRAVCKYARAVIHLKTFSGLLNVHFGQQPYDLEISVDETDTPTSIYEHYFIANEINRLGIRITSLAPRFIGRFEKGVDYIGNVREFEAEFARHAQIMRHFDTYKLSIHTGSDKFSLYPIIARYAAGRVHVKTAGTSYLEALRVAAAVDAVWFRQVFDFCMRHYEEDKRTYHVSADRSKVPDIQGWEDGRLPELFEQFDARQVMHVTFGSVLDAYGAVFKPFLVDHQREYDLGLKKHFERHLAPFRN